MFTCSAGTNISFPSQEILVIPLFIIYSANPYWKPGTYEMLLKTIGIAFKNMGKNGVYILVSVHKSRALHAVNKIEQCD